jgi:glycosyltransferase involved in cell wall biosynthesis
MLGSAVLPRAESTFEELVVCSLEPWDDIWRRNQFFVDCLLRRNSQLRVLFVEPPTDPLYDLSTRRHLKTPRLRPLGYQRRLRALRPLKPLPRRLGGFSDAALRRQVRLAASLLRFSNPTLWINDVTYAPLIRTTGWSTVYDVTDDWLAAPFAPRELARLRRMERLALDHADAVTVCSTNLAQSRGQSRLVSLIPNAVDIEHFRRPRPRPRDLPTPPVAVYVGTLHESRFDVDLLLDVAVSLPFLRVVLVGPNSLAEASRQRLASVSNVTLLGPRKYEDVPAYLQHSDVIIVPHLANRFTESLDPIKSYECLAVDRPTVATPVGGFRSLGDAVTVATPARFAACVQEKLDADGGAPRRRSAPPTWFERADQFQRVLEAISKSPRRGHPGETNLPRVFHQ